MNKSYCLGISGQKRSGKDTLCEIIIPMLEKELSKNFQRQAFADQVKKILCLSYYQEKKDYKKVSIEWIEKNKNNSNYIPEGWNMNVRDALVNIGDRFREICPTIWIDNIVQSNKNKIITDVRYPNEAKIINKNPRGLVVRIIRDKVKKNEGSYAETSLLDYDKKIPQNYEGPFLNKQIPYNYIIRNNGNIEDLKNKTNNELLIFILDKWKYFV